MLEIISKNPAQTKKLAQLLAKSIKRGNRKRALVLALEGDLGGGKTTFIQGLAKGLGIKQKILSPTFVILKKFKINNLTIKQFSNFYHVDCYRIKKPKELSALGFQEIISTPQNIVAIEWAEKVKKILPKDSLWIKLQHVDEKTRQIQLCPVVKI